MSRGDTPFSSINIYLDGSQAYINNSDSNKVFYLNTPISSPRQDIRLLIALTDAQLAYSFYIIREGINDTFKYSIDGGGTNTITITAGNYSAQTFANFVSSAAAAQAGTRSMSYSKITNKITFADSAATTISIVDGTTCGEEIGAGTTFPVSVSGTSLTFSKMANFSGLANVFVRAQTLGLQNRTSNGSIDLTLGKIPVTSAPLGFLYLATHEPVYLSITDQIIDKIAIQLQDENGNDLELNGITNWSLTLTVHHEYLKPIKDYENTHGQDVKKTDVKK